MSGFAWVKLGNSDVGCGVKRFVIQYHLDVPLFNQWKQ